MNEKPDIIELFETTSDFYHPIHGLTIARSVFQGDDDERTYVKLVKHENGSITDVIEPNNAIRDYWPLNVAAAKYVGMWYTSPKYVMASAEFVGDNFSFDEMENFVKNFKQPKMVYGHFAPRVKLPSPQNADLVTQLSAALDVACLIIVDALVMPQMKAEIFAGMREPIAQNIKALLLKNGADVDKTISTLRKQQSAAPNQMSADLVAQMLETHTNQI